MGFVQTDEKFYWGGWDEFNFRLSTKSTHLSVVQLLDTNKSPLKSLKYTPKFTVYSNFTFYFSKASASEGVEAPTLRHTFDSRTRAVLSSHL